MIKIEFEEQPDVSKTSNIWAEKYKPTVLDDFVGDEHFKNSIKSFIDKKEVQNLFLYGPAGVGKSTISKLLINTLPCDYLWINSSDENGVDTIRNKIQDFAMTMGLKPFKIIVLDEIDRTTPEFQGILRGVIDQYQSSTRFIMTCNYHEKVIEPIKSRCQSFEVKPQSKIDIMKHLVKILHAEKVSFKNEDVAFVVNSYAPDLRKIINFAQQSSIDGELKILKEDVSSQDYRVKLVELLKDSPDNYKAFGQIRQLVVDAGFSNYEEIYKYLFSQVDIYSNGKAPEVILVLADAVYQNALVFEREITFVATMHKIIKAVK